MAQLTFLYIRQYMKRAALVVYQRPKSTIFPELGDALGIRRIEELVKPACFTEAKAKAGNAPKRSRPWEDNNTNSATGRGSFGRGARGGCGRNNNFSPRTQFTMSGRSGRGGMHPSASFRGYRRG